MPTTTSNTATAFPVCRSAARFATTASRSAPSTRSGLIPSNRTPSTVTIKVEDRTDFKIRQDSVVNLGLAGITGITYVQISGNSSKSPPLPVVRNKKAQLPVIIAKPSAIKQIFEDAPQLVSDAPARHRSNQHAARDRRTRRTQRRALASIERLSANLADASVDVKTATKDAPALVREIRTTSRSITDLATQTSAVIAENRDSINQFSSQGLAQIGSFVAEAHQLAAELDRIASRLETDPSGFLLNGRAQGKEVAVPK